MGCVTMKVVVSLCKRVASIFRKRKPCKSRTRVNCSDLGASNCAGCAENKGYPHVSSSDSAVQPGVKLSSNSPSSLHENIFRLFDKNLPPIGTSKTTSLIAPSEFWKNAFRSSIDSQERLGLSLPSGVNICLSPRKEKATCIFKKHLNCGVFMVVQDFTAVDENEISVSNGELVMIENSDDPQWFWVKRLMALKEEGFIPSRCLRKVSYPSSRNDPNHSRWHLL